jgi:HEPN domain-containing protein
VGTSSGPGDPPPVRPTLGESYLLKAELRLEVLALLWQRGGYSDVVPEAQECVELALRAILRKLGIEPPRQHDVGDLLLSVRALLPQQVAAQAERLAAASKWLRKEREFSFYGDTDFIPTMEYSEEDAHRALADATMAVEAARQVLRQ